MLYLNVAIHSQPAVPCELGFDVWLSSQVCNQLASSASAACKAHVHVAACRLFSVASDREGNSKADGRKSDIQITDSCHLQLEHWILSECLEDVQRACSLCQSLSAKVKHWAVHSADLFVHSSVYAHVLSL